MLTDAFVGVLGGGLWKPGVTAVRRGWTVGRHYLDDAARLSSTLKDDVVAWIWVFNPFAKPAVATTIGYAAAEYVHDTYFSKSPGNSSQVLPAGSARPGGTKQGYLIGDKESRVLDNMRHPHQYSSVCRKGYFAKKVRGQWMCVPKSSKKSRSR